MILPWVDYARGAAVLALLLALAACAPCPRMDRNANLRHVDTVRLHGPPVGAIERDGGFDCVDEKGRTWRSGGECD